jgi:hypothetical protein
LNIHDVVSALESAHKGPSETGSSSPTARVLEDWRALESVFRVLATQRSPLTRDQQDAVDAVLRLRRLR